MPFYLAPTSNFWSTTLNGAINDSVTAITLSSTTGLQAPGVLIIDREDGNGTATPSAREFISFTGISGSDITGVTRAFDGSTARSHSAGALVEAVPSVGLWNDVSTALRASLTTDGTGIALSGTASIATMFNSAATITTANIGKSFLANVTISNSLNASGASITGLFPSGASGSVLTSLGNTLGPVFQAASESRYKVTFASKGMTEASGNVSYTGAGFTPKAVIIVGFVNTTVKMSWGFASGTGNQVFFSQYNPAAGIWAGTNNTSTSLIQIYDSSSATQTGVLSSFDSDGMTIAWSKTGSPGAGTAWLYIMYLG